MLLQERPSLEELLIEELVRYPGATAKQLEIELKRRGTAYSLRGIYKELGKLEGQGIVFKQGDTFNLHLAWIMKLLAFGDRAFESYTTGPHLAEALRADRSKKVERFSDLRKLDRFWTQMILALHSLYPKNVMCFWCPYQWFYYAQGFNCKTFYEAIDLTGYRRAHIIGNDSFLGRKAAKILPKNGLYSFAKSPFHAETTTYYTVIADCVLTVKLDRAITNQIDALFASVTNDKQLDPLRLDEVFGSRVKASVTIERNQVKANKLRMKFSEFFGEVLT